MAISSVGNAMCTCSYTEGWLSAVALLPYSNDLDDITVSQSEAGGEVTGAVGMLQQSDQAYDSTAWRAPFEQLVMADVMSAVQDWSQALSSTRKLMDALGDGLRSVAFSRELHESGYVHKRWTFVYDASVLTVNFSYA